MRPEIEKIINEFKKQKDNRRERRSEKKIDRDQLVSSLESILHTIYASREMSIKDEKTRLLKLLNDRFGSVEKPIDDIPPRFRKGATGSKEQVFSIDLYKDIRRTIIDDITYVLSSDK